MRQIVHLNSVDAEVVELPRLIIECHEFPSSRANSSIALVLEEQHSIFDAVAKLVHQVHAWERQLSFVLRTTDCNSRRQQIDDVSRLVIDRTGLRLQSCRPVNDSR